MSTLVIRGARVIDPSQKLDAPRDIVIADGRIHSITEAGRANAPAGAKIVDAQGFVAAPGFIDPHIHLRYPGGESSETVETGTAAAAAGGFTSVYCMPNTNPVCDSPMVVRAILDRAASRASSGVRVFPVASVTRGLASEELVDFAALRAAGAGAFSDDGRPVMTAELMRRAMECTRELGVVIFDHCEDMSLTGEGVMHEGPTSMRLGLKGIPRLSESAIVARDAALAHLTGAKLHICHVSNVESVEVIRWYKSRGAPITAEVSPHHLTLTDELVAKGSHGRGPFDTHAKMKPPLCEESDRQALIAALEDGTIDCIATDHAPHSPASKSTTFDDAPFGIIGLETAFCVVHSEFVATGRWSLPFLIERMSMRAARVAGLSTSEFGTLVPGAHADVVLLDPAATWRFDERHLRSKSRNCPWLGRTMNGRVAATIVAGRTAFVNPDVEPLRTSLGQ